MTVGIIPGGNAPLLPDYIHLKSLGLANAYVILPILSLLYIAKCHCRTFFNLWYFSCIAIIQNCNNRL